ncbi:MAG: YkvA family protein [Kiritimatiellia bacterium]
MNKLSTYCDRRAFHLLISAGCYLLALLILARDPAMLSDEGVRIWNHSGYPLFLAYLMTAALAWELLVLGDPHRPREWPILAMLYATLTFFLMRVMSFPQELLPIYTPSTFGWVGDVAAHFTRSLIDFLPESFVAFFANWRMTLSIVLLLCAMSFKSKIVRASAFILIPLIPFISTVWHESHPTSLLFGTFFLAVGVLFHFHRTQPIRILQAALHRLAPIAEREPAFAHEALRVVALLADGNRHPQTFIGQHLNAGMTLSSSLSRMIALDLIETHEAAERQTVILSPSLRTTTAWALFSKLPRILFLFMIALVWMILPIDLIPDALPFMGALDDTAIAILAFRSLRS